MIRITILLLFFSFSSTAQDSVTIKGKLFDLKSNTPLASASVLVRLKASGKHIASTVCDNKGRFSFKAISSNDGIELIYSKPGFKTATWTLTGVANINLGITRLERIRRRERY